VPRAGRSSQSGVGIQCGLSITPKQPPAIQLNSGEEVPAARWQEYENENLDPGKMTERFEKQSWLSQLVHCTRLRPPRAPGVRLASRPEAKLNTENPDLRKAAVWQNLCAENGWACRICGAIPDLGKQFDNNLCDDCRLTLHNGDFSNPP
jgi:hypothetical protein